MRKLLVVDNLRKTFGSLVAVDALSFDVYEGETFGLLGPNGAGKSTSINMVCGFIRPDSGTVQYSHNDNGFVPVDKSYVGLCPQEILIWNKMTCFEQLMYIGEMYAVPYSTAKKRADELLEIIGLTEKRSKLAGTLSGGMKRRLNIIMALIHDPEIVILDEPEAGLDPQSRVMVRDFIKSLAGKKTVIVTTHNMDEADRMCNRIAIIDHGKLLKCDTPENLKHTVGQGDVLELSIINPDCWKPSIFDDLKVISNYASLANNSLLIKTPEVISKIPSIIDFLKARGIYTGELKLRENTLEDVFISLTGRKLRE